MNYYRILLLSHQITWFYLHNYFFSWKKITLADFPEIFSRLYALTIHNVFSCYYVRSYFVFNQAYISTAYAHRTRLLPIPWWSWNPRVWDQILPSPRQRVPHVANLDLHGDTPRQGQGHQIHQWRPQHRPYRRTPKLASVDSFIDLCFIYWTDPWW